MVDLDPSRVEDARVRAEDFNAQAAELEAQARVLRGKARILRIRWGLDPAPEWEIPEVDKPERSG